MATHQPLLALNWNLLFSLITVVVLILILKKFFFEKVHNFMMARQKEIEDSLKEAKDKNAQAEALMDEYQSQLDKASEEGRTIINRAKEEAREEAERLIIDAHKEAEKIREENEAAIEQRKQEAKKELENEVSELAILAAQKILEQTDPQEDLFTGSASDTIAVRHKVDELKIHMNANDGEN